MTSAMQTAAVEKAVCLLHAAREDVREIRRRTGRRAALEASPETTASIGQALALLREVWTENTASHLNPESQRRLARLNAVLNEYDLPLFENPTQRQRIRKF
jgi:hypothetical protein